MIYVTIDPVSVAAEDSAIVIVRLGISGSHAYTNVVLTLDVPADLGLEQGRSRLELSRLAPGAVHEHPLRIRPPNPGRFTIGIPNLSFRDGYGRGSRVRGQSVELVVGPPAVHTAPVPAVAAYRHRGASARKRSGATRASSIFVSYRRADADVVAGPLAVELARKLPGMRVFLDYPGMRPGEDWPLRLARELQECALLIAVIGPTWLSVADGSGRRIQAPDDPVRNEIATALKREIPVIPLLFRTSMPAAAELPMDIRGLAHRQGLKLDLARYSECILELALAVRSLLGGQAEEP